MIDFYKTRYNIPTGFSDHTDSVAIPLAAITLGASIIEKHFTLSKEMYGSDAKNSFEPNEFKFLVDEIRKLDQALQNQVDKNHIDSNISKMRVTFQKSIVASKNLRKGQIIMESDLTYKKPGDGISPKFYKKLLGKEIISDIRKDDLILEKNLK